ncbi:MAG: PIN domain-containing protein [bacterium]
MNVYVESNFVLELALSQEEAEPALEILELSKKEEINLFIPAFSLAEPFWTINRRGKERVESLNILIREQRNLSRSVKHSERARLVSGIIEEIENIVLEEQEELEDVVWDLTQRITVLDLGNMVLTRARDIMVQLDLGMQDAIVLASILEHLEKIKTQTDSVFISRDRKDFGNPKITQRLIELDCAFVPNFKDGLNYINIRV